MWQIYLSCLKQNNKQKNPLHGKEMVLDVGPLFCWMGTQGLHFLRWCEWVFLWLQCSVEWGQEKQALGACHLILIKAAQWLQCGPAGMGTCFFVLLSKSLSCGCPCCSSAGLANPGPPSSQYLEPGFTPSPHSRLSPHPHVSVRLSLLPSSWAQNPALVPHSSP